MELAWPDFKLITEKEVKNTNSAILISSVIITVILFSVINVNYLPIGFLFGILFGYFMVYFNTTQSDQFVSKCFHSKDSVLNTINLAFKDKKYEPKYDSVILGLAKEVIESKGQMKSFIQEKFETVSA